MRGGGMIKLGICNEMFQGWNIGEVFRFAGSLGYDGVEVAPFTLADSVEEISQERRKEIRAEAEDAGVEVVGLHWLFVKPEGLHLNHPDDKIRNRTRDYLLRLIEFCGDLGGRTMVVGSPKQRNILEGQTYRDTYMRTLEVLRSVLPEAEARGVVLCLEALDPHQTNFLTDTEEAMRLVRDLDHPNLRTMVDIRSAWFGEKEEVPEVIRRVGPYISHVHANDANRLGPGMGQVDFGPIAEALREVGYEGYVSVEVFDFSPGPEEIARRSLEYLRRFF